MDGKSAAELVEAALERAMREFELAGKAYKKGYMTDGDTFQTMLRTFYTGFWDCLRDARLELRLDERNFTGFSAQYESGEESAGHLPWLYEHDHGSREASAEDQRQVIRLMKSFHLPPAFFEPLPEAVIRPRRHYVHGYVNATAYLVEFRCVDDGGLLAAEDPVGKSYRLTDDLGLTAEVLIREDRRNGDRSGMDFDETVFVTAKGIVVQKAEFLAEGRIRGYTAIERQGNPELLIRLDGERKVSHLAYWEFDGDQEAYRAYPLWQEFFRRSEELEERQRRILSSFFNGFRKR